MNFEVLNGILDSNNFTVGGGSASAIAGGMAAGLAAMVARLSAKKPVGYAEKEYIDMADRLDVLSKNLIDGAQQDTDAYLLIKNAYGLPKETDEEKAARGLAISLAGIKAAEVPRNNAKLAKEVFEISKSLEGKSSPSAFSDLRGAVFLSEAAVKGCILNIEANLSMIKDTIAVENFKREIEELRK